MSKQSIARKGNRFMAAHNARVLRATKTLTRRQRAASTARLDAAFNYGLFSPQYDAALAAFNIADRAMWAARTKHHYITLDDRVLIAVFGR
jgi:hypothetical protein